MEVRAQRQLNTSFSDEDECSTAVSEGDLSPARQISEPEFVSDALQRTSAHSEQVQVGEFNAGDPVCVFSRSTGAWLRDGIVVKVLAEPSVVDDGLPMPAGASKVLYGDGGSAKWVPPEAFGAELKHADFAEGDAVSVFCRSMGLWVADGLVVEVLSERATVDGGMALPAGSVKVTYASGDMAKWIPPAAFGMEVRAQRQWSGEIVPDQSIAVWSAELQEVSAPSAEAPRAFSFARSLSRLIPVSKHSDNADESDDVYIVSGQAGVCSSVLGRYHRVGEHQERPKYRNKRGAVIYFDGYWKMNAKDDVQHWRYEVRGTAADLLPPAEGWAVYHFYGDSNCPVPKVVCAADAK
jgi:hypothetical protein